MKQKIDFVVMGSEESCAVTDFGYRPLLFAKALSRSEAVKKVLVINCPVTFPRRLTDRLCRKKRVENIYPVVSARTGATVFKISEKLFMINLSSLFPEFFELLSKTNSKIQAKNISEILKDFGFKDIVLWITAPRMVEAGSKISSKIKIFDAIDDLLIHPQMTASRERIRKAYQWANDHADLITIAAESQRKMFSQKSKLFLLPNGVDDIFFNSRKNDMPADMKDLRRPIIGYVGILQDRFDVSLMESVANRLSDCSFAFVGPVHSEAYFKPLTQYKNVFFLGKKRYSEIPDYIRNFDVCILPHKINKFTDSMNPLKLYEYLGSGRPVVTTPVAGTEAFLDLVCLAGTADSFAESIRGALSENSPSLETKRRETAFLHSLDVRVKSLLDKVNDAGSQRSG